MHYRFLTACLCLACALTVRAGESPAPIESIRLLGGSEVTGSMRVIETGIYLETEFGGSLYRWAKIDPDSLPEDLRESKRDELLNQLALAQSYYDSEQYSTAAPLFRHVYEHERYLADDDIASDNWRGITYKMRGLVEDQGKWRTLAAIKADQGLYQYGGRWLTRDEIKVAQTFRAAFAKARTDDIPGAIVALKSAIAAYPETPYTGVAEQLVDRLVEKAVAPSPTPAAVPAAQPAVEREDRRPQFVPERTEREPIVVPDYNRSYGVSSYRYGNYYYGTRLPYCGGSGYSYSTRPSYDGVSSGYSHTRSYRNYCGSRSHSHSGSYIRFGGLRISF